jgi:citrate lyase beta subunit
MIDPVALGATLYIPADHPHLETILHGERLGQLRSVIVCTEDALAAGHLEQALIRLRRLLPTLHAHSCLRFVRVRNPGVLARLLEMPGAERLSGFVLPKCTLDDAKHYETLLAASTFWVMPVIETQEAFDTQRLRALRDALLQGALASQLLMVRIGANDLLALLRLRRPRGLTIHETTLGAVIQRIVHLFVPAGCAVAAPVFDHLDDSVTLLREVHQDLAHGLTGKSAIHPDQVTAIERCYQVTAEELEQAQRLLEAHAPAVFQLHGSLCEPATHQPWARRILQRATLYGVTHPETADASPQPGVVYRLAGGES